LVSGNSFCQRLTFTVGGQYGIPNSDLKSSARDGLGLFGTVNYKINERLSGLISVDGLSFQDKTVSINTGSSPLVLISKYKVENFQIGGKFDFIKKRNIGIYVLTEAGVSVLSLSVSSISTTSKKSDNYLSYRYGVGCNIDKVNISACQQFIINENSNINFFSLRLGYTILNLKNVWPFNRRKD